MALRPIPQLAPELSAPGVQLELEGLGILGPLVARQTLEAQEEGCAVSIDLLDGPAELLLRHGLGIVADVGVILFPAIVWVLEGFKELLARDVATCENLLHGDEALAKSELAVLLGVRHAAVVEGDVNLERFLFVARELHLLVVGGQSLISPLNRVCRTLAHGAEEGDAVDVGRRKRPVDVRRPVAVAPDLLRSLVASLLAALAQVEGLDQGVSHAILDCVAAARNLLTVLAELGYAVHCGIAAVLAGIHLLATVLAEGIEEDRHVDGWLLEKEKEYTLL